MSWFEKKNTASDWQESFDNVVLWNTVAGNTTELVNKDVLIARQWKLIEEEVKELEAEWVNKDKPKFLKELCDCLVVGFYGLHLAGDKLPEAITLYGADVGGYIKVVNECLIDNKIYNAVGILLGLSDYINADVLGAFHSVMYSNWSKFPTNTGQDFDVVLGGYNKVNYSVRVLTHGRLAIIRNLDQKIMKPVGYIKVSDSHMKGYIYE